MAALARRGHVKPPDRYHHGDLARAMRREAASLIQAHGISAVTLRGVGKRLGVSRSALYRHFPDKQALLAAVAADGFVTLRRVLLAAWNGGGQGTASLAAMGAAYVQFALSHPSHYRVMFGGVVAEGEVGAEIDGDNTNAFGVLLDAIVALQRDRLVRPDEPRRLAYFVWSVVHGIAMLVLDRGLPGAEDTEALVAFANARILTGIERRRSRRTGRRG